MSLATYFVQGCPVCGRQLQIRVEHLGKTVVCQHCRAQFEASQSATATAEPVAGSLLARAEQLLAASDQQRLRAHQP